MEEPDVFLGAYLVKHLKPSCEHCGVLQTSQWRKGWFSDLLGKGVLLCNACGLKYAKNNYCPLCNYVYTSTEVREPQWLICADCGKGVHLRCQEETMRGPYTMKKYICDKCSKKR